MSEETAWLIERRVPTETDGPRYLMGFRQGYGAMWTTDHDVAVRFSREVDARRIAENLECASRAVEHKWCAPRTIDSNGQRAQPGLRERIMRSRT